MSKNKDQYWFDTTYSNNRVINVAGNRRLDFTGSLKIESYTKLDNIILKKLELTGLVIIKCSLLNRIELTGLSKLTSLKVTECSQLSKIIGLSKLDNFTSLEISGCKLDKIELAGLGKLTSLKVIECPQLSNVIGLSKLDNLTSLEIISCRFEEVELSGLGKLTRLKLDNCSQLEKINGLSKLGKLENLSVTNCQQVKMLDCSSLAKLTELEVSDLTELNCSNTSIEKLSVNLCPKIEKLDCHNSSKLINLDVTNCFNLKFLDCTDSKLINIDLSNCSLLRNGLEINKDDVASVSKSSEVLKLPPDCKIIHKRKTKNLVIIGRTGGGKSTLSNVITGTDEFEESEGSISVTKNFQKKDFEYNGKNYLLIDTNGVEDIQLTIKDVLRKIMDEIYYSMPEGISQVLFVVGGSFTTKETSVLELFMDSVFSNNNSDKNDIKDEASKFKKLKNSVFGSSNNSKVDNGILEYVTIVKTKFSSFKNKEKCDKDKEQLLNKSKIISDLVKSCRDLIYVNNPPTKFYVEDDEDEATIEINKKIRARSRKILLDYLDGECQEKYFKLKTWDRLCEQIDKYLKDDHDNLPVELAELEPLVKIVQTFGCSIM